VKMSQVSRCIGRNLFALGLAAFLAASNTHAYALADCRGARQKIEWFIRDIKSQTNLDERVGESTDLAYYVRDHSKCAQTQKIMRDVEALLDDDADGVRMGAAMTLGYIGPAAKSAIPALRKTITHSDAIIDADPSPILPVNSSGEAARAAIQMITGENVPGYQEGMPK
jgi:hypothetical protein